MKFCSFLFAIMTLFSLSSYAGNVCVSSAADFEARKAQIDYPMFKSLPVSFTTDSTLVTAALKIEAVGGKLMLEAHLDSAKDSDDYEDKVYIKDVCIVGNSVKVRLESSARKSSLSGGPPVITIVDNSTVTIGIATFKKSSEGQFRAIANKVSQNIGGSAKGSSSDAK